MILSGKALLLFDLVKHNWSEIHTWTSFFALTITLLHIAVDWKILVAVLKH